MTVPSHAGSAHTRHTLIALGAPCRGLLAQLVSRFVLFTSSVLFSIGVCVVALMLPHRTAGGNAKI